VSERTPGGTRAIFFDTKKAPSDLKGTLADIALAPAGAQIYTSFGERY
jgi:hypothetical protein